MTAFILNGVRGLGARIKRVTRTRSIVMFSNRHATLSETYARQSERVERLLAHNRSVVALSTLRGGQLVSANELLVESTETVASLRVDVLALEQARAADAAALRRSNVAHGKVLKGLCDILQAINAVKSPNGTTQKVARIANAALA